MDKPSNIDLLVESALQDARAESNLKLLPTPIKGYAVQPDHGPELHFTLTLIPPGHRLPRPDEASELLFLDDQGCWNVGHFNKRGFHSDDGVTFPRVQLWAWLPPGIEEKPANLHLDESYKERLLKLHSNPGGFWYRRMIEGRWLDDMGS